MTKARHPRPETADPTPDDDASAAVPAVEAGSSSRAPAVDSTPPAPAPDPLAASKATVASLEDKLRRQQADFLNDVRRLQRQADDRVKFAVQPVIADLLGVADALHGAVEGLRDSEHERRVAEGLLLVERELMEVLGRHGVARIDAMNKPFDPAVHEALMEVESEGPERTVVQVTRPGFTLHGRVIRPATVIVSKPKA